ncbi:MAG: methylenetetrahydrofolate--tRNA-(uracil(54)-C(5))-methyltransferase (FADH(2)-oxidizing) TrmFO [Acidobacteriota bacterium]|nr:methylenetetrahydrofolate--tRNA-(uracil(54)-C(5))-methyltransferase (FADH(2)-oxidizing) TrmFO [Acidobacteriota bacterium]
MKPVIIAGGGLAGSEAAWQLAERGVAVALYEMRPTRPTPAHKTDRLGELVCSNSLKSNSPGAASWLLKEELRRAGSLLMRVAGECAVPGGSALAVDRERFSEGITAAVTNHALITVRREELQQIPEDGLALIATGPLTSDALAARLQALTGSENLAFYDSISPVVDAETLNMDRIFSASRYGKGGDDYLNCPFTEDEYRTFYEALAGAETVQAHEFENVKFFEACLPIEELCRRGYDTLRFGPMKPVGLIDPRTGRQPFAVVQLRAENLRVSSYNLVGFQNHLKFPEQKRIMRLIPGLENAEFLRLGQIHRNTYINSPKLLNPDLSFRSAPQIFVAGQLSGVEGYVECISTGLLAGMALAARALDGTAATEIAGANGTGPWLNAVRPYTPPPRTTALGSLVHYVTHAASGNYQPANISFDLLPPMDGLPRAIARDRRRRREKQCERALTDFAAWLELRAGPLSVVSGPSPVATEISDSSQG